MADDGVNIYICVVAAIITLVIFAVNIYILVYFQNEEDKNTAIFPKIVTVFSLSIVCISVLMLPLDVANTRNKRADQRGIPMEILWQVIYIIMACLAFIIPFAFFYYEAEDPSEKSAAKQIKSALKWDIVWAVLFFVPTFVMWLTMGYVEVPVTKLYSPLTTFTGEFPPINAKDNYRIKGEYLTYRISFVLYLISMIAFVGTFLLIFFGGIGLAALPLDLINNYRKRPKKRMDAKEYAEKKLVIGQRAAQLLEFGKKLQEKLRRSGGTRPSNRKDLREFNKFKSGTFMIELEFRRLEAAFGKGKGPLILIIMWEYLQLILGIIGISISITWLIHIILYMAPRTKYISLFLNSMFRQMDSVFSLFGVIAYAFYSFYLLWCVIKGNFKFGVRIPLFCTIHPMRVGDTMMNAFLFNTWIILLAGVAVVNFCANAFKDYATATGIDIIFNTGVQNLRYIKYFWWYYYWAMILVAILTLIFLLIYPSDKRAVNKELDEEELPKY